MIETAGVYRHSGRLGNGPVFIPVVGVAAAFILAIAYAYGVVYIPLKGWVSFLLTGAFAVAVGYLVSWAAMAGKCRNTGFVYFLGFRRSMAVWLIRAGRHGEDLRPYWGRTRSS